MDDGLFVDRIGTWAERKHALIRQYAEMFASSMKTKWDCRVYIDLFCSSGLARIKGTNKVVKTSPLLALDINEKFDRYIFGDIESYKVEALQSRVKRAHPGVNPTFLVGDANCLVEKVKASMPKSSKSFKVLTFCLLDPYKVDNLSFETIRQLSSLYIDFLILIPSQMDANRNRFNYIDADNIVIDKFLGYREWRADWAKEEKDGCKFGKFVVNKFNQRMQSLGFLSLEPNEFVLIRLPRKNLPLYHLAFYSRNKLGKKFWREARKYSNPQTELF